LLDLDARRKSRLLAPGMTQGVVGHTAEPAADQLSLSIYPARVAAPLAAAVGPTGRPAVPVRGAAPDRGPGTYGPAARVVVHDTIGAARLAPAEELAPAIRRPYIVVNSKIARRPAGSGWGRTRS
jgi:hypothetical protein